jgi:hypothetical protein
MEVMPHMRKHILVITGSALLLLAGYVAGNRRTTVVHAEVPGSSVVPKSYGKLVTAIPDSIGTGLIFEDSEGTLRFVSVTGMKEGEMARYETTPTRGGIPKSYGHLVSAVVNHGLTALVFEDSNGVIRFVTMTGETEKELKRE